MTALAHRVVDAAGRGAARSVRYRRGDGEVVEVDVMVAADTMLAVSSGGLSANPLDQRTDDALAALADVVEVEDTGALGQVDLALPAWAGEALDRRRGGP